MNDELHRRVVVVQYQYAVEVGAFGFRLDFGDDRRAGTTAPAVTAVVLAHSKGGIGSPFANLWRRDRGRI